MKYEFHVVVEQADDGLFSVYSPDVEGVVAIGEATPEDAKRAFQKSVSLYLEELTADGAKLPKPPIHDTVEVEV